MQDIFLWYELSGGMTVNKDRYFVLDCGSIDIEFNLLNLG